MSMTNIRWKHRCTPLSIGGLLAKKNHRRALLQRLLLMHESQLNLLRGSYNNDVIIIFGDENQLPWIPGSTYLGQDLSAKHLWLPTHLSPTVPIDLFDHAICRQFGEGQHVVNPWEKTCYNVTQLLKLSRSTLDKLAISDTDKLVMENPL
jgi:hypothetical protein